MLQRYIIIPFSSSLLPLLHNKSSFKTFHIKLSWIYMKINTLVQQMDPKKKLSRKWPIALPGRSEGGWGEEERSRQ